MPQTPIIEAAALERRFGPVTALAGVDIAVAAGELVMLLGPNGAGKTTLLRSLAGLVRPRRGTVRLFGGDLHGQGDARGSIGFVSHHSMLYDELTPRENLAFHAALHQTPDADQKIEAAIARVGLSAHADRQVRGFSRGMLQRLSLARATLHSPSLLLLDEPFTGLDEEAAGALVERLKADRDVGRAVLCVLHDPAQLWEAATRVVVLDQGRLVHDGPRGDSLDDFRMFYRDLVSR